MKINIHYIFNNIHTYIHIYTYIYIVIGLNISIVQTLFSFSTGKAGASGCAISSKSVCVISSDSGCGISCGLSPWSTSSPPAGDTCHSRWASSSAIVRYKYSTGGPYGLPTGLFGRVLSLRAVSPLTIAASQRGVELRITQLMREYWSIP
jgi:hypothetical protein